MQCGWLIAFVSSIIADISEDYPNYSWWALAYMLCCIVGVIVAVAADAVYTYHVAIVGFMAAGLVFTTSSVNSLIYYSDPAKEAAAAGFILLSMVAVCINLHLNRLSCMLILLLDRLDLLLWFGALGIPPTDSRLLRPAQGPCTQHPQQQTHDAILPPGDDALGQPAAAHVQLEPCRFRDLISRDRIPRRPNRRHQG